LLGDRCGGILFETRRASLLNRIPCRTIRLLGQVQGGWLIPRDL
jgi:hypothetical protein